ncbi:class I SAM-dependent methyltransferase [Amycolatopsis sp. EV170708-02-1]|uniref:class I SAM-dependent methyltransferase n=1 Tax=Amycolatopsis sp. EV170708-02-1 TaxID=2919322 RepID=UPI001F0CBD21|nr:class I SAM-dependent methyltransferase [Amycolatopsis sp. EV170708-02-1]UMO99439.1 methyltransferase domain-containing protein [Amycolatopsis sp. EV170708-02-1]
MSGIVNTAQSEAWNGYEGRHWAEHDGRYDAVNSGFNEFLFDAAGIGERDRVLDIGCGNGQVTRLAAVRAPLGSATGIDLSAPMLATARARAEAEGVANVGFEQGDVQVFPFGEGVFDVALSRFAVTFFADPVAAFANVRRALKPGGKLAFLCMTALAGTDLGTVFGALAPFLPTPTGEDGTGPTAFADPGRARSVLTDAGFLDVTAIRVEADQVWGSDVADAAGFIADWGPVKYHLGQVDEEAASGAREALSAALRPFGGPGGVRLRGAAWLVTAKS